jgi:hypothetical protein
VVIPQPIHPDQIEPKLIVGKFSSISARVFGCREDRLMYNLWCNVMRSLSGKSTRAGECIAIEKQSIRNALPQDKS